MNNNVKKNNLIINNSEIEYLFITSHKLEYLTFSKKRISNDVKKVLQSAIANAENNHGLDVDKLFVKEAFVGKGLVMKRLRARARGRAARILKPFSHLSIIVHEKEEDDNGSES